MPSLFEQTFAAQATALRDTFGTSAAYKDQTTAVTGLKVRVQRNEALAQPRSQVDGEIQSALIIVLATDLANPMQGGRFTVAGTNAQEVWTIQTTPTAENGEFICACSTDGVDGMQPARRK